MRLFFIRGGLWPSWARLGPALLVILLLLVLPTAGRAQAGGVSVGQRISELEAVVAQDPANAGAAIDLVLAHCEAGSLGRAQQAYQALAARLRLPEGIAAVVESQLAQGCLGPQLPWLEQSRQWLGAERLQVSALLGWSSNVNAASSSEGVWLGEGGSLGYYTLAPSSRPQSDFFGHTGLGLSGGLGFMPSVQWYAAAGLRVHFSARSYDSLHARLGVYGQPWLGHEWSLEMGRWYLGGRGYESVASVSYRGQLSVPVTVSGKAEWSWLDQDQAFNARRLELALGRHWAAYGLQWAAWIGPVADWAQNSRPGGDRFGLQAQGQVQGANRWGGYSLGLRLGALQDAQAYSPALFGPVARRSRKTQVWLRQDLPQVANSAWAHNGRRPFIILQLNTNRDRLPLFTSRGVLVQVGVHSD